MTLEKLISNFELFDDWEDRYSYLIDLGKKLPGLSDAEKTKENRLYGCQSMIWMIIEQKGDALHIRADSDSLIVRGLIAVLMIIFDGKTQEEIRGIDTHVIFKQLGLDKHLSLTRKNGLFSMVDRICWDV